MVLMRQLLIDAQAKFRKMMSDNKALALKIDQDLQSAHYQVSVLRAELADTNQKINDIYCNTTATSQLWSSNTVMAGNVITTCMPPTTTTNTAVNSTADGGWCKSVSDCGDPSPAKKDRIGSPLANKKVSSSEEKTRPVEEQPTRDLSAKSPSGKVRAHASNKMDNEKHCEVITTELKVVKSLSSKRITSEKADEVQKKTLVNNDFQLINGDDGHSNLFEKQLEGKQDRQNSSTLQNAEKSVQCVVQRENASSITKESSVSRRTLHIRQSSSPLSRSNQFSQNIPERGPRRSESTELPVRDSKISIGPKELKQIQLKGPLSGNNRSIEQYSDIIPERGTAFNLRAGREKDHSVLKISDKQNKGKGESSDFCCDNKISSQNSCNKITNSWLAESESSKQSNSDVQSAISEPVHQVPATKATVNKSLNGHEAKDNDIPTENKPYCQPWCSDTGDSLSDILTSDDCSKDQSESADASYPANAVSQQKTAEKDTGNNKKETVLDVDYSFLRSTSKDDTGVLKPFDSEFETLKIKCSALQRDLEEVMESRDEKAKENAQLSSQLERCEKELKHAKDTLSALKQDRKRLKAEKFDLLTQMKQLYSTLEDKEDELREFIRNYEQKMKDSEENLKQLSREREELEKEKWSILQRAREEAERCVVLCTQLSLKDAHIRELQEELNTLREKHLSTDTDIRQSNGYGSPTSVSYRTVNGIDSRGTPTPTPGSDPTTSPSYSGGTPTIAVQFPSPKDSISGRSHIDDCSRPSLLSRSAEDIFSGGSSVSSSSRKTKVSSSKVGTKEKKGGTWGSISRVFSRNKQRRKALDPDLFQESRTSWSPKSSLCSSPLSEESYAQKLRLLEESHGAPMQHWRAATVLAWLEITMDMPQYGTLCAENIKSGKVLLELSDSELEEGLGISNAMHRRKLRLAIEEHREPSLCRYPKICLMTHSWVIEEWLPSIALTCYSPSFSEHLVDGRVLDTLTKKDLEKYFGITRKFHQLSIMHAIQLLRMMNFDRQMLNQRRMNCESMDVDPLVWTNQRFIKWANSIDLGEYADNLRNGGVHGALAVLEPSFNAETMATSLGIPASKNIIRRHLTTEWQNLIQPARLSIESESLVAKKSKGEKRLVAGSSSTSLASQGKSSNLVQSYARRTLDRYDRKRTSWRFSTWRSSQESLKSTSSKKVLPTPQIERPRLLPLSPKLNATRHRRTFSSHSDVETLTVTPWDS